MGLLERAGEADGRDKIAGAPLLPWVISTVSSCPEGIAAAA